MTQKELLESLLEEINNLKKGMPNGELKRMEQNFQQLHSDVKEIKKTLLDPKDGLIVEVNKNTEWREERQKRINFYDDKVNELEKVKDWKDGVTKALWVLYSITAGLIIKLIFGSN